MYIFCIVIVVSVYVLYCNSGSVHVFIVIMVSVHVLYFNGGTRTGFVQ